MEGELRGDSEQVTQRCKASLTKAEGKLSSPAVRAAPHDDSGPRVGALAGAAVPACGK